MKYFIGTIGEKLCRGEINLKKAAATLKIRIIADPQSYSCEFWQPLRNDGNDGKWLMGGSFVKFHLFFDEVFIGLGPLRQLHGKNQVEHEFQIENPASGRHVIALILRIEKYGFSFEAEACYTDGEIEVFKGQNRFRELDALDIYRPICLETPQIYNYFKGDPGPGEYFEHIDGNKIPENWKNVNFNDANWAEAPGNLRKVEVEKAAYNYQYEQTFPENIQQVAPGHYLIDFGKSAIGGLQVQAPECGGTMEIRLGEELLEPSAVRYQMRTGNCYQEIWNFSGGQTLEHFGLRVFRYAEIVGYPGELTAAKVSRRSVRAPFDDAASFFHCDNEKVNKIWDLCKYSIKATNLDLYNDCFSRERIAYEGDSYIVMLSDFAVNGNPAVAARTLEYMVEHHTWPCEWFQMMIPLFYEFYMHTGDLDFVGRHFERLVEQSAFEKLSQGKLVEDFPYEIIIDWPEVKRDNYDMQSKYCTVPNCLLYYNFTKLAFLAAELKRNEDFVRFSKLAEQLKIEINENLFDRNTGLYRDGKASMHCSLHANVWALWCGVVPEAYRENILDFIVGKKMACSIYMAQYLLDVLFTYGRSEAALNLLLDTGETSWLNMIKNGASITTESWNCDEKANMSWAHPWGSSPANLIVRHIFGLRPTEPGWRNYEFKPLDFFRQAQLKITIPHGSLEIRIDNQAAKIRKKSIHRELSI